MWLLRFLFSTSIIPGVNSEITRLYEDVESEVNITGEDYIFSEEEMKHHSEVEQTLQHYWQCRGREWSCDKHCRLEFRSETKLCRAPLPGDNCFGIPITYKYSRDFELIRFPQELAVLSRYPRCWSYLSPLICTTLYRPCSRHFFIEKDERNNVKNGTIELWQLLSRSLCETAHKMCADVVSSGLFPSMINCGEKEGDSRHSRPKRVLYSTSCQISTHFNISLESFSSRSIPNLLNLSSGFLPGIDLLKTLAKKQAVCVFNKAEHEEYQKRHTKFKDCKTMEAQEFLKCSEQSNANEKDTNLADLSCQDKSSVSEQINSNWKEAYNDFLSKESLHRIFDNEVDKCYRSLTKRIIYDRNFGLSSIWTVTSFVFVSLFLAISPVIHYLYINTSSNREVESIVEYINCGTAHAIENRLIDWLSDDAWASLAALESSSCSLPLKEAQDRLESVFTVFIILPALPFVVLLLAFLTGAMKVRAVFADTEVSKYRDNEECCELVPMVDKTNENVESTHGTELNRDLTFEEKGIVHETDSSSKSTNRFSANVPDGVANGVLSDEKENCVKSEETEDSKQLPECKQEKERKDALFSIINELRDELAFQQSMLINDNAAWNISLYYMRRTEQLLSQIGDHTNPVNSVNQGLLSLFEEMLRVLPTVSDHALQLWRWMNSVHETSLKLDYLQGVSNDHGHSHSVFESQDVYRQHNLLALNSYLLQSQSRMKENLAGVSSVSVNGGKEQTKTQQDCSLNKKQSSKFVTEVQKIGNKQVACIPSTSQSSRQEYVGNSEAEKQNGPDQNIKQSHHVPNNVSCDPSESNERIGGRSLQTQRYQGIPRISAYASSYSATPRGILTRLSLPELRLRVQQIKNICAGDHLYPQELAYMLLVIGDITQGGNRPQENQFFYAMEQLPGIFGTRVPTIDARVGVQDFLTQMRRRALTVVGAVGYHFSFHTTGGTSYTPPVLPPLGLYRSENELVLRRVLGDSDDVMRLLRDFLREFQFGRGPINPRPDLKFAFSFRNYLAMVATREGFNNDHYEEYITDPVPPPEDVNNVNAAENCGRESDDNTDPAPPS
ncbi:unnamed protein product [Angiostrongylus costaricensis]|uniref:Chloride channel CLIC-like protein 1 n=1 Tax=Angiostrongylus costaricensis TaxID=334426 RepID=A0A0R3PPR3_ANGCS|nr:unnamed protein product [Angiostrongylus costaricensis]